MKIKECLSTEIVEKNKNIKYFYRITEDFYLNERVYGIEVERQDYIEGKIVNLERDNIAIVSNNEVKVKDIITTLCSNTVSPIHLIDIIGEYSDNFVFGLN